MENQINNMFVQVNANEFKESLKRVQNRYSSIKQYTTPWNEIDLASNFFIAGCPAFMGYAVSENGELTSVFSCIKRKGDIIMQDAIQNGARHLIALTDTYHSIKDTDSKRQEENRTGLPVNLTSFTWKGISMNKSKCPICGYHKWTKPKWAIHNQQRKCNKCKTITNKVDWKSK